MLHLEIRGYRAIDRADISISNIALVAGMNGDGKTTVLQAARACLHGHALVVDGVTKKTASMLVRRGFEAGMAKMTSDNGNIAITWPKCTETKEGSAPAASIYATGVQHILDLKDKTRAMALAPYIKAMPSDEDATKAMTDVGYSEKAIKTVLDTLKKDGWDSTHSTAFENGSKVRGRWEGITNEKYGTTKAEGWKPEGWAEDLADADMVALKQALAEAETALENAIGSSAVSAAEMDKLRELAAQRMPDIAPLRNDRDAAFGKVQGLKAERDAAANVAPDEHEIACPSCGSLVCIDRYADGKAYLRMPKAGKAKPVKPDPKKAEALAAEIRAAEDDQRTADIALSDAQAIASNIESAKTALAAGNGVVTGTAPDVVQAARDELVAARTRIVIVDAAALHKQNLRNAQLVEILAPEGLRRRTLVKGLGAFNDRLAELSNAAKWPQVRLDENLDAHFGTEPYWNCSEAQQFRVRTTIQLAMAEWDGSACVLIDRADVLDQKGRNGLFWMLKISSVPALVCCTFNTPDLMPNLAKAKLGESYWISSGEAVALGAIAKAAE